MSVKVDVFPQRLEVDWDSFLVSRLLAKFASIDAFSCQYFLFFHKTCSIK